MDELPAEYDIMATFHASDERAAAELVASAWKMIEKPAPGFPKVNAKRLARAKRLRRLGENAMLISIVAQWLSAKRLAKTSPEARMALARIGALAGEVEDLRRQMAQLAESLHCEMTTDVGFEVAGHSQATAGLLTDALPHLHFARELSEEMLKLLPAKASGSAGAIGALRQAPPDTAVAFTLARLWTVEGLSLSGGEDGDGLDRFLAGILGEHSGRKALSTVRSGQSTENRIP